VDALITQIEAADGIGGSAYWSGNREEGCTCSEVEGETVAECD
jgi:hypothetical protein